MWLDALYGNELIYLCIEVKTMILLTGATGFLGKYILSALLHKGEEVKIISRKRPEETIPSLSSFISADLMRRVQCIQADITEMSSLSSCLDDVDEVIHAAAKVSFQDSEREDIYKTNITGTKNLLGLCYEKGIKRFHYVSSIAALGRAHNHVIDESFTEERQEFSSDYSRSKYDAEKIVREYYQKGLTGIIINPGVILGPVSNQHFITDILEWAKKGVKFFPSGINGYVDVRDTADILIRLREKPEYYNQRFVVVAENVSYKKLFEWVCSELDVPAPVFKVGKSAAWIALLADSIRSFLTGTKKIITPDLVRLVTSQYLYDNNKIKSCLNYSFIPVEKSVKDMIKAWKDSRNEI